MSTPAPPIAHMFVLMLENHSFDNMFALSGIPGIHAANATKCNSYNGRTYCVHGSAPPNMPTDPGHEFTDVLTQLAGVGATYPSGGPYPAIDNSGFAANYATSATEGSVPPAADIGDVMACFNTATQLPVIYQLATEYVLCDQWFASMPGPTWPNRFFVHGASSSGLDHSPSTNEIVEWESFDGFRYPHGSIYDAMNSAHLPWRLYHDANGPLPGGIPQVSSLHNISIFDIHSLSKFSSELQNQYKYRYTFIEPNYGEVTSNYQGGSSQHPMDGVFGGEQLIKTVYEAIRNSPVWTSSMLIITYDEHGGFYDSFAPGSTAPPNDGSSKQFNQYGFNFGQAGLRVPAVVISPWVAKGFVDHTVYDHASIPATVEALCGLKALTDRDAKANNLLHLVQPSARTTDCPTTLNPPAPAPVVAALTAEARFDLEQQPVPDMGNLSGFLSIMLKTDLEMSGRTPAQRAAIIARFKRLRTRRDARAYIEYVMNKVAAAKAAPTLG